MSQVDSLLSVGQVSFTVYSHSKLIPELLPMNDVAIKHGYIKLDSNTFSSA